MPPFIRCPRCDRRFRRPPADDDENCCPFCDAALDADETERDEGVRSSNTTTILIFSLVGVAVLGLLCTGVLGFAVWRLRSLSSLPERNVGAPPVGEPFAPLPPFQEQKEDYAQARRHFQTQLIRQDPAPQLGQIEQPPAGVREVTYQSGNLRLRAWVNGQPPDARKRPAVLFLHGGFAFGADDWQQTQPFRDAGFVVMTPTLRGENGLPGSYSMFYDEVEDVLAAAETLAKLPYVDSNRLYVSGHSVGGTLTMLASMTSNRFRAAASFSGSPDQVSWSSGQPQMVPFIPTDQREFQMRSPLAFPQSFKCPVRIYYGNREFFFAANSQQTAKWAKMAGLDVEAVSVPGDHLSMVEPAMKQAIAFFQQK